MLVPSGEIARPPISIRVGSSSAVSLVRFVAALPFRNFTQRSTCPPVVEKYATHFTTSARAVVSSVGDCAAMGWRASVSLVPRSRGRDLQIARPGGDDDAIELRLRAGLVEQRHVDDGDGIVGERVEPAQRCFNRAIHRSMHDRFERRARSCIGEDDRTQPWRDRRRRSGAKTSLPNQSAIAAVASVVPADVMPCTSGSELRTGTPRSRSLARSSR
jgi:hypothetical protein